MAATLLHFQETVNVFRQERIVEIWPCTVSPRFMYIVKVCEMLLLFLLLHLGQSPSSQAAPLFLLGANNPILSLRSATSPCTCPDSDQRSVWDILWSCLVVVFACSWVSVHPDIPAPGEGWMRSTLRRLEYMLWTLLAPELMIYWAGRQFLRARQISKEQHEHKWTTAHGHFLQMGGFMLFDGKKSKGVLSYKHFKQLLNHSRIEFPEITEEEIKDRGKSDGLGKILVIAQTGWFILQCISRKAQGLDITELELGTLAFAALNGCMYFFWWDKPFDVHMSVPVRLLPAVATLDKSLEQAYGEPKLDEAHMGDIQEDHNLSGIDPPHNESLNSMALFRKWFRFQDILNWPLNVVRFIGRKLNSLVFNDDEEVTRFEKHDTATSTEAAAFMRVPTFYYTHDFINDDDVDLALALFFVGSGFGAIHCAGWSFHFPSTAELWIWRMSALSITGLPVVIPLLVLTGTLIANNKGGVRDLIADILAFTATYISIPIYIAARLALLAEAFAALRDLRPGALAVVKWTSFIPHIS